jgi:hypothetical protein
MRALALCALLAASGVARAEAPDPNAPTVGASLDHSSVHVGDRVSLTVSAVAKAGIAVTLPPHLDLGKLEILDRSDDDREGRDLGNGRRAHRFVLQVAAYELGDLEVPPIAVSYFDASGEVRTVETAPITLHVTPLVGEDQAHPELQPIRPPRSSLVEDKRIMRAVRWGAIGLGGALALALIALMIRRALRRRAGEVAAMPAAPRRPPEETAMAALRALRAAGQFGRDLYRPFYFAVAEIVRAYLGERYRFDALELTTRELIDALGARAPHLVEPGSAVVRFLDETDLVKFAKTGSTDGDALKALDAAESIVLSTAAPLETAAQSAAGPVLLPRELPPADKEGQGG